MQCSFDPHGKDTARPALRAALAGAVLLAAGVILGVLALGLNWPRLAHAWLDLLTLGLKQSWRFPVESVTGGACALGVLAAMTGLGWTALRIKALRRALPLAAERVVFAPLIGQLIFGLGMLAAAQLTCRPSRVAEAGLLMLACGLPGLVGWLRAATGLLRRGAAARHTRGAFWWVAAALFVTLVTFVYALAPSVESDELRYHLAAPLAWLKLGRMEHLSWQAFSDFPFLGEMGFLAAMGAEMALRPDALVLSGGAKLVHTGFLPVIMGLTALISLRLAREMRGEGRYSAPTGRAGLAVAFLPMAAILAGWGFIDIFVTAWWLAFVYVTLRALARPRRASAWLSGLVCAGGAGVKYSMLPLMAGLGALWFLIQFFNRRTHLISLRLGFGTAFVTALLGGPWYLRNWLSTGNPFYPLAWGRFGGGDWSEASAALYMSHVAAKGHRFPALHGAVEKIAELAASPWTTTFYVGDFEGHVIGLLPLLALVLLFGWLGIPGHGPGCLARSGRWRYAGRPAWFALLLAAFWVFWFLTYQSSRMLLPALAMLLAAAGAVWANWNSWIPKWAAMMTRGAAMSGAALGLFIWGAVLGGADKIGALRTALGFMPAESHVRAQLDYAGPALDFARALRAGKSAVVTPPAGVLLVGEHRTMHFPAPLRTTASDWFDTPQPLPWMRAAADDGEMLDLMRAQGIEWVFFNQRGFRDHNLAPRFTREELDRFARLWSNPRLKLWQDVSTRDILIYAILPRGAAGPMTK